jgi:hypothetical protein
MKIVMQTPRTFRAAHPLPAFAMAVVVLAFIILASSGPGFRMVPDSMGALGSEQRPEDTKPLLRFHLAEFESIPGVAAVVIPERHIKLWPRPEIILSEAHVDSAIAGYGDFALQVQLKLDGEGRRRVQEATRENVGRYAVVFLADEFIMAPMIQAEINTDVMVIDGGSHTAEQWDAILDRLAGVGVGVVRFAETPGAIGQDLPPPAEEHQQLLASWDDLRDRLDARGGRYSRDDLDFVGPLGELAMLLRDDYGETDAAREIVLHMEEIVRARLGQDGEELILPLYGTLGDLCDADQHERAESLLNDFLSEIAKPEWQAWPSRLPPELFIGKLASHWVRQGQIERAERMYEAILAGPFWIARQGFDPYLRFVTAQDRSESLRRQCRAWQARAEADTLYGEGWRQMAEKGLEALAAPKEKEP